MRWIEWLLALILGWRREPRWKLDGQGIWRIAHKGAQAEVLCDSDGWRFHYINELGHLVESGGPFESERIAKSEALDRILPF